MSYIRHENDISWEHFHTFRSVAEELQDKFLYKHKLLFQKSQKGPDFIGFSSLFGFFLQTFLLHRIAGEGEGYPFNISLPLPPASQTLRHYLGDYCRELTSTHS